MSILHLIPKLSGGGAERQLIYLAPALADLGHKVHIAYFKDSDPIPELPASIELHRLKARSNYDPHLLWQLVRLIKRIKPTIIHTWIVQMDILGGIAAKLNKIPYVLREPSSAMAYTSTWKTRMRVLAGSRASAIVTNSEGGAEYWKSSAPNTQRYIVRNGIPLNQIVKIDAELPVDLHQIDAPIILYVGRLTSDITASKNLKVLLEALAMVKQQRNIFGVFCGDGPQRPELEMLRDSLALDSSIYFTGQLSASKVWSLMKKSTVFVSLSAYEGCPNSVMEAMACGCPLVLSDIPAHREIVDENSALFVNPDSIEETANAILHLLAHADETSFYATNASRKTLEWSIGRMAQQYEMVYRKCIKSGSF